MAVSVRIIGDGCDIYASVASQIICAANLAGWPVIIEPLPNDDWQEILRLRSVIDELVEALRGMNVVYGQLHSIYGMGDCDASIAARKLVEKHDA